MTEDAPDEILTIAAVARLMHLHRQSVSKLIAAGLIPSIRLSPRIIRVPRQLLLDHLNEMAASLKVVNRDD